MRNMQPQMAALDPDGERVRFNLELFRKQAGLSRSQLSILSSIPEKNIVRWESGDVRVPAAALPSLAKVLGRDPGDFHKEKPGPGPKHEDLPALFLSQRPDTNVPDEILRAAHAAIERWNNELRGKK